MTYSEQLSELKRKIKLKFKTLKHFGECNEIEYKELNKFFAQRLNPIVADMMFKNLENVLKISQPCVSEKEIPKEDREDLRVRIFLNYRSVDKFIVDNPSFSKSFISNVISGRRVRKDLRFNRLKEAVHSLSALPELK